MNLWIMHTQPNSSKKSTEQTCDLQDLWMTSADSSTCDKAVFLTLMQPKVSSGTALG